jgi:hypothetical protein
MRFVLRRFEKRKLNSINCQGSCYSATPHDGPWGRVEVMTETRHAGSAITFLGGLLFLERSGQFSGSSISTSAISDFAEVLGLGKQTMWHSSEKASKSGGRRI